MATIAAIHSYAGGTGRSLVTINLACLLALQGRRVAVVDANLQAPGLSLAWGLKPSQITYTFNDYLRERCGPKAIAYDISPLLAGQADQAGQIYGIPASSRSEEIAAVLTEGYDVDRLWESFYALDDVLDLDVILVDVQAGINEEIMNIISGTLDHLVLLLTPNPRDLMGTAMLVDLAEKLEVLNLMVVVNKVGPKLNPEKLRSQALAVCRQPIATLLPLASELLYGNSQRPFCLRYTHHPLTQGLGHLLEHIVPSP